MRPAPLRLYGEEAAIDPLAWAWVEAELAAAGTYWVVARSSAAPHPRPVWGVWLDGALMLTVGSPRLAAQVAADATCTVHLDSGTDVVIVEGEAEVVAGDDALAAFVGAYDAKYDWSYSPAEYGAPTRVRPATVMAWRSAGWAGREGFRAGGKWRSA